MRDHADSDVVIEAISENLDAKRALFSAIEPHLRPDAILASNSSSIPASELARGLAAPQRFCGMHFCHPVAERRLVEVIGAETTDRETMRQVCDYATTLEKSPVVVRDRPGFALNRILSPYLTEALELLLEGVEAQTLNQAARDLGMPCGPLRQIDGFGIDVALAVGGTLLRAFPDRFVPSEMLVAMYKAGRLGAKSGGGFYAHDNTTDDDVVDPAVRQIVERRRRRGDDPTIEQVRRRLWLPMYLEATRVLDDRIVDSPATVDALLRDGLGMTSEDCGPFRRADAVGADVVLEWLRPLRPRGRRFEPTPFLLSWLKDGSQT